MTMANLNGFDANNVDPAADFEPIPAGNYPAIITASEMKPTKNGTGRYLELTFDVLEGAHKGRLLWSRLNIENPSAQAVGIAQGELSAICRAVGVMQPKDSAELHNLPLTVKVKVRKREDNGDLTNEVRGYAKKGAAPARNRRCAHVKPDRSQCRGLATVDGTHCPMHSPKISDEVRTAWRQRGRMAQKEAKFPHFTKADFSSAEGARAALEEAADLVRAGKMPVSVANAVSKLAGTALKASEVALAKRLAEIEAAVKEQAKQKRR